MNKKIVTVLFFLINCAFLVFAWCVKIPTYMGYLLLLLVGPLPLTIALGKNNGTWHIDRVPHYLPMAIGMGIVTLIIDHTFLPSATDSVVTELAAVIVLAWLILVIYQFRPELLHLKEPPEEE